MNRRFELLLLTLMLILGLIWYAKPFYSQIVNLFSETGKKIEIQQAVKI